MELQWVPHQDLCVPLFFFVIMKKFGFIIVLLNLNLLSVESMLIIHSYFFTGKNQHKNIKFTSKTENEGSIAFLDIKITSDNNKFMTSVYHKPTFSRVLTNFGSFIPKSYKYKLLFTLLHRHSNFAQILNVLIRKLTSLRLFLKIMVTSKMLLISVSKSTQTRFL